MPYYPKSQIITNLYTNGGEFTTTLNDPSTNYVGYYWKTISERYYIGKIPKNSLPQEIYPYIPQSETSVG